jgi:glycerophosphoryl diester phosphodiesterase
MGTNKDLIILGHRGAIFDMAPFYQNSLRAFEEAIETADGFETDACVDRDGEIFLIHEAKYVDPAKGVEYCAAEHLDAASAALMGSRRIDEMTTEEMRRLRLRDGSPVPTLKEAIQLVGSKPGRILNIELKAYGVTPYVLDLLRQSIKEGIITPQAVLISSFNHPALIVVRRETPEFAVGALFNYPEVPEIPIFPWQPESKGTYVPLSESGVAAGILKDIRPDQVIMPQEIMTQQNFAMLVTHHPYAKCSGWVFTERKNSFSMPEFLTRLDLLRATGKLAAMLVDNPREFVKALSR